MKLLRVIVPSMAFFLNTSLASQVSSSPPKFIDCDKSKEAGVFKSENGWLIERGELQETFPNIDADIFYMERLSKEFSQQGILLIPVLLPLRPMVYPPTPKGDLSTYNFEKARASYNSIIEKLESSGVTTPNILKYFLENIDPPLFFYGDHHITPAGAHRIAISVFDTIKNRPEYVSLQNRSFHIVNGVQTNHPDPSRTAVLSNLCGKQPEEFFTPPHAIEDGNVGLFDEEEIDVAYVGTSMGRPAWGLVDYMENALSVNILDAHLDAGGSLLPMIDYLASLNYNNHKPKIIIWEWSFEESLYHREGAPEFNDFTYYNRIFSAISPCKIIKTITIEGNSTVSSMSFQNGDFIRITSASILPDMKITLGNKQILNLSMPERLKNRNMTSIELPETKDSTLDIQFSRQPNQHVTFDFCHS